MSLAKFVRTRQFRFFTFCNRLMVWLQPGSSSIVSLKGQRNFGCPAVFTASAGGPGQWIRSYCLAGFLLLVG